MNNSELKLDGAKTPALAPSPKKKANNVQLFHIAAVVSSKLTRTIPTTNLTSVDVRNYGHTDMSTVGGCCFASETAMQFKVTSSTVQMEMPSCKNSLLCGTSGNNTTSRSKRLIPPHIYKTTFPKVARCQMLHVTNNKCRDRPRAASTSKFATWAMIRVPTQSS